MIWRSPIYERVQNRLECVNIVPRHAVASRCRLRYGIDLELIRHDQRCLALPIDAAEPAPVIEQLLQFPLGDRRRPAKYWGWSICERANIRPNGSSLRATSKAVMRVVLSNKPWRQSKRQTNRGAGPSRRPAKIAQVARRGCGKSAIVFPTRICGRTPTRGLCVSAHWRRRGAVVGLDPQRGHVT